MLLTIRSRLDPFLFAEFVWIQINKTDADRQLIFTETVIKKVKENRIHWCMPLHDVIHMCGAWGDVWCDEP